MKALYLDLQNGIAGDMFFAALLDLGLCLEDFAPELGSLALDDFELEATEVSVQHIAATSFEVKVTHKQPHRHLSDIIKIIKQAKLSKTVKKQAASVFKLLAAAEAKIHGTTAEKIHFHEVGAVDSIIDILGCLIALEKLGVEKIYASVPVLGGGEVSCAHGILPLPAPATLEILKDILVRFSPELGETVTPTGAALLKILVPEIGDLPTGKILKIGYGAGQRQDGQRANLLRAVLLEIQPRQPEILVVETNLDDMNPELLPPVLEKLLQRGALDVYFTPIQMKKNRPAVMLSAIIEADDLNAVSEIILKETSTFGLRHYPVSRIILERCPGTVKTPWGVLKVKVGYWEGKVIKITPEFASALELSVKKNVPLIEIYAAVNKAAASFKIQKQETNE